ncbi:hypothetical protein M569_17525, partial [Genlisea aurea]
RPLPSHSSQLDARLAAQYDDIQVLLADNQRFTATHVALRQDLGNALRSLSRADDGAHELREGKDSEMDELIRKSSKMEGDIRAASAVRSELIQVDADIKQLTAVRVDLTAQVQMMTREIERVASDLRRVPALKSEVEGLRHDLQHLRSSIENQKKSYAQSTEHGKVMESKLASLARETEKIRSELSNAEKRAAANHGAALVVANPG